MSRRAGAKKEKKETGSGLASTLLLAGGAAAVGYMASELWNSWNKYQEEEKVLQTSTSSASTPNRSNWTQDEHKDSMKTNKGGNVGSCPNPENSDFLKCIVCMDNFREVILEPCSHFCLCNDCLGKNITNCPVCSQSIIGKRKVYMP